MKKSLSLLLALAMVLSMVPVAFAEEAETLPSYDLSYAFNLVDGKTFKGGPDGLISDYDGGLTPARTQLITSGTIAADTMADLYALGYWYQSGYWTNQNLNRPSVNHFAPDDTNNANKETGMTSLAFTYNPNIDAADGDYVGDESLYGTMAYNFSAGRYDELAMTADTGSTNGYGGSSLPTIRFKAPKSGYINPVIKLATLDADGLLYRVRKVHLDQKDGKLNHAGWISSENIYDTSNATWTDIYPKADETTYTRYTTDVNKVIAPLDGWAKAPANVMTTRNDALIYVEARDEINLTFAKTGKVNTRFAIDTVRMDYVDEFTLNFEADYAGYQPSVNVATLLKDTGISLTRATYALTGDTAAILEETETAGVYNIRNTVTDGQVATLEVVVPGLTLTLNIKINVPKMVYDLGEAYAVNNTFSGDAVGDYSSNLSPKTAMNKSNTWYLAYGWGADGHSASYAHDKLTRPVYNTFAPEDQLNPFRKDGTGYESLSFSYSSPVSQTVNNVTYKTNRSVQYGNIAYNFGGGALRDTSTLHVGGTSYLAQAVPQIVFTAPKAGLINPKLVIGTSYDENRDLAYRVFKNSIENNIYPKDGEMTVTAKISPQVTSTAMKDGWAVSEYGTMTTRDDAYVWVNEGDKIYILFETVASDYKQMNYTIDTVQMIYTYVAGETMDITYNGSEETTLNLAEKVSAYGLPGTPVYTLKNDNGALAETETAGVYEVVGNTIDGAIVEAICGDYKLTFTINSTAGESTIGATESQVSGCLTVDASLSDKNFFAVACTETGEVVGTTTGKVEADGAAIVSAEVTATPAYVRLFFWEDLNNIAPYWAPLILK